MEYNDFILNTIYGESPIVAGFLQEEMKRQEDNIELIASNRKKRINLERGEVLKISPLFQKIILTS